jgi:hypothetical protein
LRLFSQVPDGAGLKDLESFLAEGRRRKMGACNAKGTIMMRAVVMMAVKCSHQRRQQKKQQENTGYILFVYRVEVSHIRRTLNSCCIIDLLHVPCQ